MLMDVLGIAIAFVTIILLLSILVTAAVQATQGVLRLRGRNLQISLAAAILKQEKGTKGQVDYKDKFKAKWTALKALGSRSVDPLAGMGVEGKTWRLLIRYCLVGPRVSKIDAADLPAALVDAGIDAKNVESIKASFQKLEPHSAKRFEKVARGWSVVWALAVAFLMQVSTPALLNKLATNAEYRESVTAGADRELAYAEEAIARLDYETAAASALETLARRHEDLRPRIEQASGVGTTKRFIVEELRLALEGVPAQQQIVQEYEKMLDEAVVRDAGSVGRDALSRLAAYDIRLWPRGTEFYYKQPRRVAAAGAQEGAGFVVEGGIEWHNLLGVFITAILLSLGAPWWFDRLRDLIGLRDRLSLKPEGGSTNKKVEQGQSSPSGGGEQGDGKKDTGTPQTQ